jgi:hypothetical protein
MVPRSVFVNNINVKSSEIIVVINFFHSVNPVLHALDLVSQYSSCGQWKDFLIYILLYPPLFKTGGEGKKRVKLSL